MVALSWLPFSLNLKITEVACQDPSSSCKDKNHDTLEVVKQYTQQQDQAVLELNRCSSQTIPWFGPGLYVTVVEGGLDPSACNIDH